jgi:lysophospholipase L1-like esterase
MYRFQITAQTQAGESIGIVGSMAELGLWDAARCIRLRTSKNVYPLWWTDPEIDLQPEGDRPIEYKYVRLGPEDSVEWESWGTNRWLPNNLDNPSATIVVDDGAFGYMQTCPFGYIESPKPKRALNKGNQKLKIVVIGSSVAQGYKAWLLGGWSRMLGQTLERNYGHQLVNVSEPGANVSRTIHRFGTVVAPEKPDIVIIALSLGNEGFAYRNPSERRAAQKWFENGLLQLVQMTRDLGALPILGGVYPHGDYTPEHHWFLQDTHHRMMNWNVPVLDWLSTLEDGQGRWKAGTSFDPSHPNTLGHQLMYQAIDLKLFEIDKAAFNRVQKHPQISIYADRQGFNLCIFPKDNFLRINNPSQYSYTLAPYWTELQTALQDKAKLIPGIYIAQNPQTGILPYFAVNPEGGIETMVEIPPGAELNYIASPQFLAPNNPQVLFYDGHLGILKEGEDRLWVINESEHEFNIHPMWPEVRKILKKMPPGVYCDPLDPEAAFRTLMIGPEGLESRVKAPARSAVLFQYQCKLSDIHRVAIVPLGARCAARMLLYKLEFDGPAYPFDLTRTTNLGDIANMIEDGFEDMWNPELLHYNAIENRIYHSKWSGLSFAHEVEDSEDPIQDMSPIHERMRTRYKARAERFWYTLRHSDKFLFVRNGFADRGTVIDLMEKLAVKCQGKPFHLLLISPQPSQEYADLTHVIHYNLDFDPDRMYADLEHWMQETEVMGEILTSLGISSKNLFWCPPNPVLEKSL